MGGCAHARPPAMCDDSGILSKTSPPRSSLLFLPHCGRLPFLSCPLAKSWRFGSSRYTCRTTRLCHTAWAQVPGDPVIGTIGPNDPYVCISHAPISSPQNLLCHAEQASKPVGSCPSPCVLSRVDKLLSPTPLNDINRVNSKGYLTQSIWRSIWHAFRYMSIERTAHASLSPLTTSGEPP